MRAQSASRPFTWDDVDPLHRLVASRWESDKPRNQTRIGDFYWVLRNTPPGDPLRHLRVWPGGNGALAGVAWLDPPSAGDIIVAQDAASTFDEALDWLEEEHSAAGSRMLSIVALDGDASRAAALRHRAYRRGEGGNVRFWRALDSAPAAVLPPDGYAVRAVSSEADLERRAFVEMDGFGASSLTADAWRSITTRLPRYRRDLDLIAVAPGGGGASSCTCWFDAATRNGEFEAVATAKAHRRMGAGKAVIMEGLRRLHALGAANAIVETMADNAAAIALYTSCGFELVARDYNWLRRG